MKNENDFTTEDLVAATRGVIATDRAVAGIMQAVREARLDDTVVPVRRWDRGVAWAIAATGLAVLSVAIGREYVASRDLAPASISPRIAITDSANTTLPRAVVAALPNEIQVAMDERGAVLEGVQAVHIDSPMRLTVINGALRVEPNTGITPPGR